MSIISPEGMSSGNTPDHLPVKVEQVTEALQTYFTPFFDSAQIQQKLQQKKNEYMTPGREHMPHWERAMRYGLDQLGNSSIEDTLRQHLETFTFPQERERYEQRKATWEAKRGEALQTVFAATQNPTKQEYLTSLAQKEGVHIRFLSPDDKTNEEALQKVSFMRTASPVEYAQILAKHKGPLHNPAFDPDKQAYLGLDTIVTTQSPLEEDAMVANKPKSTEEAFTMIRDAAGKKITVITGIDFSMPTYEGETIIWPAAILTSFTLRNLTNEEIHSYMEVNQRTLSTSGAIDYASLDGQRFIDQDAPLTVSCLETENENPVPPPLMFSPKAAPFLKEYFLGVPQQPLQRIFQVFPTLYK